MRDGASHAARSSARSPFGCTGEKDWWGRSALWAGIFKNTLPPRKKRQDSQSNLTFEPPRFDETVSVVNAWYHATGFGVLQRMLVIILKHLEHMQLQTFYLLLDSFDAHQVFRGAAPKTNASNFFILPESTKFNKQISRMVDSYGNFFVAAECLEIVLGYNHEVALLFRNWVSVCVSYLFDLDGDFGTPSRNKWDIFTSNLLTDCQFALNENSREEKKASPCVCSKRTSVVQERSQHSKDESYSINNLG